MSDYQKYDIGTNEDLDIKENFEPIYKKHHQHMKLIDKQPQYYKLGVKPVCNEIVYPHTLGYTGNSPKLCVNNHITEDIYNKYCDLNPWYCNKHY